MPMLIGIQQYLLYIKYALIFVTGILVGRLLMGIQFAVMKPKTK